MKIYRELEGNEQKSFVLFASGSGFGYLYDVVSVLAHDVNLNNTTETPVIKIHYTVRSIEVYNNFANEIQSKLDLINKRGNAKVSFNWYVTTKASCQEDSQRTFNDIKLHRGNTIIEYISCTPLIALDVFCAYVTDWRKIKDAL